MKKVEEKELEKVSGGRGGLQIPPPRIQQEQYTLDRDDEDETRG